MLVVQSNQVLEKEELEVDNTAVLIWEVIEIIKLLKINQDSVIMTQMEWMTQMENQVTKIN